MTNSGETTHLLNLTNDERMAILSKAGIVTPPKDLNVDRVWLNFFQKNNAHTLGDAFVNEFSRRLAKYLRNENNKYGDIEEWYHANNQFGGNLPDFASLVESQIWRTLGDKVAHDCLNFYQWESFKKLLICLQATQKWNENMGELARFVSEKLQTSSPVQKGELRAISHGAVVSIVNEPSPASGSGAKSVATKEVIPVIPPVHTPSISSDQPVTAVEKTVEKSCGPVQSCLVSDDRVQALPVAPPVTPIIEKPPVMPQRVTVPPPPPPPPPAPAWKYLKLPVEPDMHEEYAIHSSTTLDGKVLLGARVRGKKHKHEGTHCDDWFEVKQAGTWTIMAVADGGGSYKFSRVGAKAACQGVVEFLTKALADCTLKPMEKLTPDIFKDSAVIAAHRALYDGMNAAWDAVKKAFEDRKNSLAHARLLSPPNRDMSLKDLYSTLLVTIRTSVETSGESSSLGFSCAAGDGMIAVISSEGGSTLLMKPDGGEFSSEVEFFTEKTLKTLESRTYPFAGGRVLMLMTDGVADDYFPHDRRMGELFADLVLNGIIPLGPVSQEQVAADIKKTKLQDLNDYSNLNYLVEIDRLLEKTERVRLASAQKLADALGVEPQMLAKHTGILVAALESSFKSMPDISKSEDRLLTWLDTYQVRGSFDDRTILLMFDGGGK